MIIKRVVRSVILLIILLVVFYFITNSITKYTGFLVSDTDNSFEKCLKEKNIRVHINSQDPIKTLESLETSDYLAYIDTNNCLFNKFSCKNIDYFPTWEIDGEFIEGDISVSDLSKLTGCEL